MPPDVTVPATLLKAPTGIAGFDEITLGGLPAGRPSLVCGAAGCGKTLFAVTFLVNGATRYDEPGVFMSFEERAEDLAANVASLGYDLDGLVAGGKLADRPRPGRAQRDRGERRVRPRGAVRAPGLRRGLHRREARGARHHRDAVLRLHRRRAAARRAAPPVRLDQGSRPDGDHHRGARRGPAHPAGPGGVRLRLRGAARQPGRGPDHHAAPARGEVSRLGPRHQRVPVPDRP